MLRFYAILVAVCLLGGIVSLCQSDKREKTGHEGRSYRDYPVWGLDLSRHQPAVDWDKVLEIGAPDFVFLKATEGTLIKDPIYRRRAEALDRKGIVRGAYHFFGHRTSGREQAENFIRTADLKPGNIIPVLDIEKHRFMTDGRRTVREAKAFCMEIKRHYGVMPIIYCSTLFYERYLQKDFSSRDYVLWIADYRGNPDYLPWTFWQHTEKWELHGTSGKVDRNVFAGTKEELQKLVLK